MESIIGTIVLTASAKRRYGIYHLVFTDTRAVAIDATDLLNNNAAPNPLMNSKAMSWLSGAAMLGAAAMASSGGYNPSMAMSRERNMENSMEMQAWNRAKNAAHGKPIVSYDSKELTDTMTAGGSLSFSYDKIKKVQIKKALIGNNYSLHLDMGLVSAEVFELADEAQDQVTALIKKTPLASKLQQ